MFESGRVLLAVIAILIGGIAGVIAGVLAATDGASTAAAVKSGFGAFLAATVLTLTLMAFMSGFNL
ncbi:hypothetical protein ACWDOP_05155 [Nocardia sp. NPDC003693]